MRYPIHKYARYIVASVSAGLTLLTVYGLSLVVHAIRDEGNKKGVTDQEGEKAEMDDETEKGKKSKKGGPSAPKAKVSKDKKKKKK